MSVTGGALAWDGTVWLSWGCRGVPACVELAEEPNEAVAGANVLVGTAVRVTLRDDCGGGNGEASY
ncbi:hypothetical protein PInf_008812 [Phytophthora infestans]|nr:hypothetical protein PInf_008812 [Phytophthora infestans]